MRGRRFGFIVDDDGSRPGCPGGGFNSRTWWRIGYRSVAELASKWLWRLRFQNFAASDGSGDLELAAVERCICGEDDIDCGEDIETFITDVRWLRQRVRR